MSRQPPAEVLDELVDVLLRVAERLRHPPTTRLELGGGDAVAIRRPEQDQDGATD